LLGGTIGSWQSLSSAASPPPGTAIENQATGTFVDDSDPNSTQQLVESNVVSVTVGEVAGVAATAVGITGDATAGNQIYATFKIVNKGNDPTQFFLPGNATITNGSQNGLIQVVGYSQDGTTDVDLSGSPIDIPAMGITTGNIAFPSSPPPVFNGSFFPDGYITVRVPVTVATTVTVGNTVTVILGDTPPNDNSNSTQNQSYAANASNLDIYTVDNTNPASNSSTPNGTQETIGNPLNGTREASAKASIAVTAIPFSGYVFEDVNFGGGVGRNRATAGTVVRPGATVELYDSTGRFLNKTAVTDGNGKYSFDGVSPGDYYVRVVNSTVTSSRSASATGIIPVQTFRTTVTTVDTVTEVVDRVGGEVPSSQDAPAAPAGLYSAKFDPTTFAFTSGISGTAESVAFVKVGNLPVSNVDFGFNFDTIVNNNDSGQGSLRQFIINSNALPNAGLAQFGQTAGREVSIFQIPNGTATPGLRAGLLNQVDGTAGTSANNGTAAIVLNSPLPAIVDANTSIDGTTQTANVGDSNGGQVGTGGNVGALQDQTISKIDRPEIVIDGRNLTNSTGAGFDPQQYALTIDANYAIVQGLAVYGTKGNFTTAAASDTGAIRIGTTSTANITTAGAAIVRNNFIGTFADGTDPGTLQNKRYGVACFATCQVERNYFGYNGYGTLIYGSGANNSIVSKNEYQFNGANQAPGTNESAEGDSVAIWGASNVTVKENLIANTRSITSNTLDSGKGIEVVSLGSTSATNNTIANNTILKAATAGIGLYSGANNNTIYRNRISETIPQSQTIASNDKAGAGILLSATGTSSQDNQISENSIFNNQGLGIDIDFGSGTIGDGVTANNGAIDNTKPNNRTNYPVIAASSNFSGNILTLKGFVGNNPAGSPAFAGAKIEFFITDNNGGNNEKGEVLVGDSKNRPHGEGKTFIGSCFAGADSKFDCQFTIASGTIDPKQVVATATYNGSTSEFSAQAASLPRILLIKRITAIKDNATGVVTNFTAFRDDTTSAQQADDNNAHWPGYNASTGANTYILGEIAPSNTVKPGDEIEYTIYFLNPTDNNAAPLKICDAIKPNQSFRHHAYGANNRDIEYRLGTNNPLYLSSIEDVADRAQFYPTTSSAPASCNAPAIPNGTRDPGVVTIDVVGNGNTNQPDLNFLRGAIADVVPPPATPYYGSFRFRTRVD
jgi:hypothetical protein